MQYNKIKYKGYIYCIRNKINNKKYIGRTAWNINKRFGKHKGQLINNKHYSNNLQEDFNKYSMDNFEFIILDEFTFYDKELLKKVLKDMERFYIDLWDTENETKGYNNKFVGMNSKKIQCIETGEIFNGSQSVIDKMFPGRSTSVIRDHLRGRTKSAFGLHFKFIDK